MNQQLKILREVVLKADHLHEQSEAFGQKSARALDRAQITGLASIANSTLKVADVLDYLKIRTARSGRQPPARWNVENLGRDLISYFQEKLSKVRDETCATLNLDKTSRDAQEIYLLLIREFIRQMAAEYELSAAGGKHDA